MANKDASFGLKPVRMIGGSPYNGGQSRYRIANDYDTNIFQGDLVAQVTGGGVEIHAVGGTVPIVGVFNGCTFTDPTSGEQVFSNYYPASTAAADIIANIIDDPMVIYEIQSDAAFPIADLLGNFDVIKTNAGSTKTGISGDEVDVSTGATTATLPLKVIDISQDPNNQDVAASNTNVYCTIQNHVYGIKQNGLA